MKNRQTLQTIGSVAFFVALFLVVNVFSFGLTVELLYDKLTELSIQIIASVISLIVTILLLVATRFSLLRRYRDAFAQAHDVIEKLTRGDFNVPPAGEYNIDPKLGRFVESIDTMAVELKKVEDMRREFVSNVSHEIGSPLTNIRGYAKALEANATTEQREYLAIIQSESDRLSKLSENLLRLASLDAETSSLNKAAYRLDRQIRSVVLACEPEWSGKNIEIEADFDEVTITADAELLTHVWANLLGNATKFTPYGGRIYISLSGGDGAVIFTITDTGVGIKPEVLPHIFDRFYKADESRGLYRGSGLGLSIVKKIVELHGGEITVESEHEKGSVFEIMLPK
jgi:signal transduction histidine kinase